MNSTNDNRPLPNILAKIRATKEGEVASLLETTSFAQLEREAGARLMNAAPRTFEAVVTAAGPTANIIAEVKKASPSKGIIREPFHPEEIAAAYFRGGASAISCLTDEQYFQGKLGYLQMVRDSSPLPVLRKDFIISEAQVFQSCAAGADAILLIARMLDSDELIRLYRQAKSLRLGVLLEIHDLPELEKALDVNPSLIGINNRDLDTFVVDTDNTFMLRESIPAEIPVVAESGINSSSIVRQMHDAGIAAVLVGEHLMRQEDIEKALRELRVNE